jgi:methylenetetrahydrofolate reductase (NADPH)
VNGVPSADPVFGFGPAGGYVYQKAFVEFFVDERELDELTEKAKKDKMVTWYASNRKGEFRTNMESGGANAVTWGVFKGQEIVTTTLIEEVSFKAWKVSACLLVFPFPVSELTLQSICTGRSFRGLDGMGGPVRDDDSIE